LVVVKGIPLFEGEEYTVFIPECHGEPFTIKLVEAKLGSQKAVVQIFMGDKLVLEDVIGYNVDIEEPERNVGMVYCGSLRVELEKVFWDKEKERVGVLLNVYT